MNGNSQFLFLRNGSSTILHSLFNMGLSVTGKVLFQDAKVIIKHLRGLTAADIEDLARTINKHGPTNTKIGSNQYHITREMVAKVMEANASLRITT